MRERARVIERENDRSRTLVKMLTNLSFIPSLAEIHALYIPNAERLKFLRNCQICYSKKRFIVNVTLTIKGLKEHGGLVTCRICCMFVFLENISLKNKSIKKFTNRHHLLYPTI